MNRIDVTHLVVNGCSWTYGTGLAQPKEQAWPALLANKLGIPLVNLAIQGSGNDTIHRRTYEYIFKDLPNKSKPLVVIGWSQFFRQEAWFESSEFNGKQYPTHSYRNISIPTSTNNLNEYQVPVLNNWNDNVYVQKTLLYKSSLKSLFNSMGIPYIMTDMSLTKWPTLPDSYKSIKDFVYDQHHVDSFYHLVKHLPKLPCGHEDVEAHKILADYSANAINKLYGTVTPTSGTLLSYKEFVDSEYSKYVKMFSAEQCWM